MTTPVQKIITAGKGVAIDYGSVSRSAQSHSKELYLWGHAEADDLRDVTDRLAHLHFLNGTLSTALATKLDAARAPLKTLRGAETAITPRRNIRAGMELQINRVEHSQQPGMEAKVREMKAQLQKAQADDEGEEKEIELMKRKVLRDSEQLKWEALREYGEKISLLAQASVDILSALPSLPPSEARPYTGASATAAARAAVEHALETYKLGTVTLPSAPALGRSNTRMFGESHASEIAGIVPSHHVDTEDDAAGHPGVPAPAPVAPVAAATPAAEHPVSTPIDPSTLNNSPAPIPAAPATASGASATPPPGAPDGADSNSTLPPGPTIAETGIPVMGGNGPASGNLHDLRANSGKAAIPAAATATATADAPAPAPVPAPVPAAAGPPAPKWESAEEEKARLRREEAARGRVGDDAAAGPPMPAPAVDAASAASGASSVSTPAQGETAAEEKRRLEREERERLLTQGGSGGGDSGGPDVGAADKKPADDSEDLPPYQPF
jgi:hypothetical protein